MVGEILLPDLLRLFFGTFYFPHLHILRHLVAILSRGTAFVRCKRNRYEPLCTSLGNDKVSQSSLSPTIAGSQHDVCNN